MSEMDQHSESACDVRRGSAFLCQLASTDRRPVGILTNLPTLQSRLSPRWPILERCGDELFYQGPLTEYHVHAFQRMLRSGERTQRSTSSPPLPNRRAQCCGQFVWPTSTWTVSFPLGMGFLSWSQYRTNGFIHTCSFSSCSHSCLSGQATGSYLIDLSECHCHCHCHQGTSRC